MPVSHLCENLHHRKFPAIQYISLILTLVPRLSWNTNCTHVVSLVSFLPKHVTENRTKTERELLHILQPCVQPTMCSTLGVYDIQSLITRYM